MTAPSVRTSRTPRIPRVQADTWQTLFGVAYLAVMTNMMLAVASLPLLVLLVTTDPASSWPALAIASVAAAPGLGAAATVFAAYTRERSTDVIRVFLRGWLNCARRALALGTLAVGVLTVIAVDLVAVHGSRVGALLTPILLVLGGLVLAAAPLALVAGVERPDSRLRDVLAVSVYFAVRHWYLTAVSLVVLALLALLFVQSPAIAVGLAASPLLYVVWGNSRYSLRSVLPVGSDAAPE